jgi:hypothetical protein
MHENIPYFCKTTITMEAIRHIVTPMTNHLEITLPDNLVHEKLEVIILAIDEPKTSRSGYKSLMGSVSRDEATKMLEFIEASRKEWE